MKAAIGSGKPNARNIQHLNGRIVTYISTTVKKRYSNYFK